jgi:hypothetical protein
MEQIIARLELGKTKYKHGVRVDNDTMTWGTQKNSWMEMANEEFLDGIIYVTADYIRRHRENGSTMNMGTMEYNFLLKNKEAHELKDDNELILYILENWMDMENCKHKMMIKNLFDMVFDATSRY